MQGLERRELELSPEVRMAQHLTVAVHLSAAELKARFQAADDAVERAHLQALYLAPLEWRSANIAAATGHTVFSIRKLVRRYNAAGTAALQYRRHLDRGQPRLLTAAQEAALDEHLRTTRPPGGGLWTSAQVAKWMSEELHRPIADVRGWEVLRRLGYRPRRPRRRHGHANQDAQEALPADPPRAGPG